MYVNISAFSKEYFQSLKQLLDSVDPEILEKIVAAIEKASVDKSRIYVLGNGGSAGTASHMANDLGVGLKRREILSVDIVSLADNVSVCSALANDIGYENIFHEQLRNVLTPQDLIIAISCSGNSPNIIKAVEYAREIGSKVVGLTGFEGGQLRTLSDISYHVQTDKDEYGLVEDAHMILDHVIYTYFVKRAAVNTQQAAVND